MRTPQAIPLLLCIWLLPACWLAAATNLMPGLTYYKGREQLKGRLVFLYTEDGGRRNPWVSRDSKRASSGNAAAIYEISLPDGSLRKVTDCPGGILIVSAEGNTFCTVGLYSAALLGTNAKCFAYFRPTDQKRIVDVEVEPTITVPICGRVFLQLEKRDYEKHTARTEILEYDIATDQKRTIKFEGASEWQYEKYENIHVPQDQTNVLHFEYGTAGKRLRDGTDYREGVYSFDISTREIRWFANSIEDTDDPQIHLKTFDGRYVFFDGPQGPRSGFRLVSSPTDFFTTKLRDPQGKQCKKISEFSQSSAAKGGTYYLIGLSPDGRYVLICFEEVRQRVWARLRVYYLTDVSTGTTRILLKDEVEHKTSGLMSPVQWVK